MKNKRIINEYVNNFKKFVSPYLNKDTNLLCTIYPSNSSGSILIFTFKKFVKKKDIYMHCEDNINNALKKVQQEAFGGNLDAFKFSGTNILLENNEIIIIKGEDNIIEWNNVAAKNDVEKVLLSISKKVKL